MGNQARTRKTECHQSAPARATAQSQPFERERDEVTREKTEDRDTEQSHSLRPFHSHADDLREPFAITEDK